VQSAGGEAVLLLDKLRDIKGEANHLTARASVWRSAEQQLDDGSVFSHKWSQRGPKLKRVPQFDAQVTFGFIGIASDAIPLQFARDQVFTLITKQFEKLGIGLS
jgi:hypothetical protein